MTERTLDDVWSELVSGLNHLESILPAHFTSIIGTSAMQKRFELEEDVRELEEFIDNAGDIDDEHSLAALAFLHTELIRKRSLLDSL